MTELQERLIEIGASLRLSKGTYFLVQEDLAEKILNGEKVKVRSKEEGNHWTCFPVVREEELVLEAAQHVLEERYGCRIELFADAVDVIDGYPVTMRRTDNSRTYNARFYEECGAVKATAKRK